MMNMAKVTQPAEERLKTEVKESEAEKVKGAKRNSGVDLVPNGLTRCSLAWRFFSTYLLASSYNSKGTPSSPRLLCQVPPYRSLEIFLLFVVSTSPAPLPRAAWHRRSGPL